MNQSLERSLDEALAKCRQHLPSDGCHEPPTQYVCRMCNRSFKTNECLHLHIEDFRVSNDLSTFTPADYLVSRATPFHNADAVSTISSISARAQRHPTAINGQDFSLGDLR